MEDIKMIPVASSNVESIGYDENDQVLRIRFLNGNTYDYKNVPIMEFERLKMAHSIGSYLHRNIKFNYPYEKVA
jgi:hypothetical protein